MVPYFSLFDTFMDQTPDRAARAPTAAAPHRDAEATTNP